MGFEGTRDRCECECACTCGDELVCVCALVCTCACTSIVRFSLAGLASPLCVYVCACTCKSACNLSVGSAPIALRAGAQLAALAQGKLLQLRLACVHPQLTQYWKTLSNELQLHQARASVHACCKLVCTCVCVCVLV